MLFDGSLKTNRSARGLLLLSYTVTVSTPSALRPAGSTTACDGIVLFPESGAVGRNKSVAISSLSFFESVTLTAPSVDPTLTTTASFAL